MPNTAQTETYNSIVSLISQLRGERSYVPLPRDQVTELSDSGDRALFYVGGARVFIHRSGNVRQGSGNARDNDLPDSPRYASGLGLLPAVAADLLMRGNPHKAALANHSHTPVSFMAYLQHGTRLGHATAPCIHQPA